MVYDSLPFLGVLEMIDGAAPLTQLAAQHGMELHKVCMVHDAGVSGIGLNGSCDLNMVKATVFHGTEMAAPELPWTTRFVLSAYASVIAAIMVVVIPPLVLLPLLPNS